MILHFAKLLVPLALRLVIWALIVHYLPAWVALGLLIFSVEVLSIRTGQIGSEVSR